MSPEQANPFFEDVDSRSDVYSLGVLLYELISGVLPFDFTRCLEKGSVGEIQRVILEREPSLPSTRFSDLGEAATKIAEKHGTDVHRLRRELKGDLDWIVMKALEKDRSRRYATVLDLERDIERHLRSEPVSAGPPTLRYRARKFLRRRRGALTIGGLAAALLVAATVVGLAARSLRSTQLKLRFHQAKLLVYNAPATAAEQLYAIIEEEPQFIDARNELAFLLHRENRIPDAITVAEATVAGKHETGPAHLLLAQIYEHRDPALAAQHLSEGRRLLPNDKYYQALSLPPEESAKAVALLGELLSADHTNFDVRWNRAWRYFDLRQYERMLEDANHLLGNYPNSAAALSTRGKALRGLGKLDEAIADFTQAIELNPDHAPPYVDRGEAFHEDGQSQQAIQNYTRAIGIEPKFADAHAQRGLAYLRAGRAVEAGIDCDEALRLQPDGALGYLCRARLRARDRHYDEALADLDHAIQLKPNDPRFLFERAYQLRRVGRYEAAIADYSKCLALGQDRPELAYCNRALAHARLDQFDAALADYGSGLAVSSSSYCHYGRARVLRWLGRYAEALADHDRALSIEPENADYCSGRGVTRWLSGDFNGAAADIEGFLSKTSGATDERAFKMLWLWQIYATLGDAERAATALEEAAAMPGEWPAHIIAYVRDQSSIDEVITKSTDNGKKCEAYYYFGAKALVDGRKADAAEWFKKCVDLRYRDYAEYDLALGLLPTLAVQ
jgi:tetratricopeptide (TPR) repeat protein